MERNLRNGNEQNGSDDNDFSIPDDQFDEAEGSSSVDSD